MLIPFSSGSRRTNNKFQNRVELSKTKPSLGEMRDGEERYYVEGNTMSLYRKEHGKLYKVI